MVESPKQDIVEAAAGLVDDSVSIVCRDIPRATRTALKRLRRYEVTTGTFVSLLLREQAARIQTEGAEKVVQEHLSRVSRFLIGGSSDGRA